MVEFYLKTIQEYALNSVSRNIACTLVIFGFGFGFTSLYSQKNGNPIRLFYLGGQSNMTGFGYNKDLPGDLEKPLENVYIFQGNPVPDNQVDGGLGIWEVIKPGHGIGFTSDGNENHRSDRFGVELTFARKMKELYPNEKIAIIKYARNGSSLDSLSARQWGSWEVDYSSNNAINQYDNFLATVNNALKNSDIDNDGVDDTLIPTGIVWMQGESDAYKESAAHEYHLNLKKLMNLIRAVFRTDDLPVVIGKITDSGNNNLGKVWKYGELVQHAQEKYVASDKHAKIVRSTQNYEYSDPYHYNSDGYIDLGEKFAEAIHAFQNK
ncbi:MAG: sialate O-acetylesterase [Flavobacteriaceae bacterium]